MGTTGCRDNSMCVKIELLCVVCWAQAYFFIGILSCGKGFTFRYISGPGRPIRELMVFLQVVFETFFGPHSFRFPSLFYEHQKDYMIDWIECQQPREILYHGPGLCFPFLLKFLLTHSPRAFKPSLISFRAPWFYQDNLCAMFRSHFVERQQRQKPSDVILKGLWSSLPPTPPSFIMPLPIWPCRYTWPP